jgi:hypothetical protein
VLGFPAAARRIDKAVLRAAACLALLAACAPLEPRWPSASAGADGGAEVAAAPARELGAPHDAGIDHDAASELESVWVLLRSGHFREGLATAYRISGEHRESARAAALVAFLEDRVGRSERALDRLGRSRDPALAAEYASILIDRSVPARARVALDAWSARSDAVSELAEIRARAERAIAGSELAATGIVIDAGRRVLTSASLGRSRAVSGFEVANAAGVRSRARLESQLEVAGLATLVLDTPLDRGDAATALESGEPVAGSVCIAISFAPEDPRVERLPFAAIGRIPSTPLEGTDRFRFSGALTRTAIGAPLFDETGRWIGVATELEAARAASASGLRSPVGATAVAARSLPWSSARRATDAVSNPISEVSVEEIYERAFPILVRVTALH